MKPTPSIRAATIADAEMLTELSARTFHDAFSPTISAVSMEAYMSRAFTVEQLSSELADSRSTFLILEIEAAPVGYVKLRSSGAPDCVRGVAPIEIERFYLDRQFHGSGLAHTMMQFCLDHAKQSGHQTIYLGVWEHNPRAIAFYRKWGFEIIGSHVFQMGDEEQNDYWMARELQVSIQ